MHSTSPLPYCCRFPFSHLATASAILPSIPISCVLCARVTACHDDLTVHSQHHGLKFSFLFSIFYRSLSITEFHNALLAYKYACLFRERTDGSLRGMLMLDVEKKRQDTTNYTCLKVRADPPTQTDF